MTTASCWRLELVGGLTGDDTRPRLYFRVFVSQEKLELSEANMKVASLKPDIQKNKHNSKPWGR